MTPSASGRTPLAALVAHVLALMLVLSPLSVGAGTGEASGRGAYDPAGDPHTAWGDDGAEHAALGGRIVGHGNTTAPESEKDTAPGHDHAPACPWCLLTQTTLPSAATARVIASPSAPVVSVPALTPQIGTTGGGVRSRAPPLPT
ncbi:hypothetical protein BH23DEI1_BH23DEI1_09110 [soil metagenome]